MPSEGHAISHREHAARSHRRCERVEIASSDDDEPDDNPVVEARRNPIPTPVLAPTTALPDEQPRTESPPPGALSVVSRGTSFLRSGFGARTGGTIAACSPLSLVLPIPTSRKPSDVEPPRTILMLGAAGTGKSSLINAFRRLTSPSLRWERAPIGKIGRQSAATMTAYFNTSPASVQSPTWCFVDSPGRIFHDLSSDDTNDARLLKCLLAGMPDGIPVAGRSALTLDDLERLCYHEAALHPEAIVIVVRAIDLLDEQRTWMGLRTSLLPKNGSESSLNYLSMLFDFVHHITGGAVPRLVVTHMDCFHDPIFAEERCRKMLADICPVEHQHYVGLPPESNTGPSPNASGVSQGMLSSTVTRTSRNSAGVSLHTREAIVVLHRSLAADVAVRRTKTSASSQAPSRSTSGFLRNVPAGQFA